MSRTFKRKLTGSKASASSCRNHGGCAYCKDNRTFFDRKHRPSIPTVAEAEDQYWDLVMYDGAWYEVPTNDFWEIYDKLNDDHHHRFMKWLDDHWEDFEPIDLYVFVDSLKMEAANEPDQS